MTTVMARKANNYKFIPTTLKELRNCVENLEKQGYIICEIKHSEDEKAEVYKYFEE